MDVAILTTGWVLVLFLWWRTRRNLERELRVAGRWLDWEEASRRLHRSPLDYVAVRMASDPVWLIWLLARPPASDATLEAMVSGLVPGAVATKLPWRLVRTRTFADTFPLVVVMSLRVTRRQCARSA